MSSLFSKSQTTNRKKNSVSCRTLFITAVVLILLACQTTPNNRKGMSVEEAQNILDDLLDQSKKTYFSPYLIARVYSGLGENEKVFEWLDSAYEVRDPCQYALKVDIEFHSLHSDPRWTEVLKKRGLAD